MALISLRSQGNGFRLTFNYRDIDADLVILTLPFSILRRIPTSDAYQGYMQGAAQSGRLAANTVLSRLDNMQ